MGNMMRDFLGRWILSWPLCYLWCRYFACYAYLVLINSLALASRILYARSGIEYSCLPVKLLGQPPRRRLRVKGSFPFRQ